MNKTPLWEQLQSWQKDCNWVELSYPLSENTPHWSGFPAMSSTTLFDYPDGFFVNRYDIVSQYGTHVDSPMHFVQGMPDLASFTARQLVLPLCVIDISGKVRENVDYELLVQDVADWEAKHGRIPEGAFVAIRSDWHKREDMNNYDDKEQKHYPGWGLDSLKFLVERRNIAAIGHETSDTDSAVGAVASGYACEYYILQQNRFQVELMINFDQVP
ncbi:MAG: cyclase family protein, partial [Candidatus Adiutrix sp.]|nr:cyclase family protein [Candidatus Adiutrix sp.]